MWFRISTSKEIRKHSRNHDWKQITTVLLVLDYCRFKFCECQFQDEKFEFLWKFPCYCYECEHESKAYLMIKEESMQKTSELWRFWRVYFLSIQHWLRCLVTDESEENLPVQGQFKESHRRFNKLINAKGA